jgi:hypothetical protein
MKLVENMLHLFFRIRDMTDITNFLNRIDILNLKVNLGISGCLMLPTALEVSTHIHCLGQ